MRLGGLIPPQFTDLAYCVGGKPLYLQIAAPCRSVDEASRLAQGGIKFNTDYNIFEDFYKLYKFQRFLQEGNPVAVSVQ